MATRGSGGIKVETLGSVGCDCLTLQVIFGHSLSTTTGRYVADNPRDNSSLRLVECIELLTATLY